MRLTLKSIGKEITAIQLSGALSQHVQEQLKLLYHCEVDFEQVTSATHPWDELLQCQTPLLNIKSDKENYPETNRKC